MAGKRGRPSTKAKIDENNTTTEPPVAEQPTAKPNNNTPPVTEQPKAGYNPLDEAVIEKPYARDFTPPPNVNLNADIPEPDFKTPQGGQSVGEVPFANTDTTPDAPLGEEPQEQPQERLSQPPPPQPKRPSIAGTPLLSDDEAAGMSKEDNQMAAENMADFLLGMYEDLHKLGKNFTKISDNKKVEITADKKLPMSLAIPLDDAGQEFITLNDYINTYNESVDEILTVDKGMIKRVRPRLIRVCEKHGIVMTDEQQLAVEFGKDIVYKTAGIIRLKSQINKTMDNFAKMYNNGNAQAARPTTQKERQDDATIVQVAEEMLEEEEKN